MAAALDVDEAVIDGEVIAADETGRPQFYDFLRGTSSCGGTADPFLVHWPKGIKAKGEIRTQYAHAIDMVRTVLTPSASNRLRLFAV